jgi:hypothetical protein
VPDRFAAFAPSQSAATVDKPSRGQPGIDPCASGAVGPLTRLESPELGRHDELDDLSILQTAELKDFSQRLGAVILQRDQLRAENCRLARFGVGYGLGPLEVSPSGIRGGLSEAKLLGEFVRGAALFKGLLTCSFSLHEALIRS